MANNETFSECLLVGGPFDGQREQVADSADAIQVWVADADNLPSNVSDELAPEAYNMRTVTYYRKQLTAEGLRRPLDIFTTDREASTGWLLQRLVLSYPEPKTNG